MRMGKQTVVQENNGEDQVFGFLLCFYKWLMLDQCFSDFTFHQKYLVGFLRNQLLGPKVSDSVGLGWNVRIHISNRYPGNTDTVDLGATF